DMAALQDGLMRLPDELDIQHAGPAEDHGKAPQVAFHTPQLEATEVAPVDLRFFAGSRLVANGKLAFALRSQRLHEVLQDGVPALIALIANLTQDDLGVRHTVFNDPLPDVLLVGVQLGHSVGLCLSPVMARRPLLEQAGDSLAVNPQFLSNRRLGKAFG